MATLQTLDAEPVVRLDCAPPADFSEQLISGFTPTSESARDAVSTALCVLAEQAQAHAPLVGEEARQTIEAIVAALDRKIGEQVNEILHHPELQALEASWRGLHHLVSHTETDERLKIRVLNLSKKELQRTLRKYKGTAWDQSPIFKKVYEEEYGQFGGEPYGCLVGDYYFDHGPLDTELLGEMARIAAAAHAPFITAASPALMQMHSWQELANPRDLSKIFQTPEYAAWRALRECEDSRYVGLAMPRMLARLPYGAATDPVDDFEFEEEVEGGDHQRYVWANAAYAMATNITRSFKLHGWCSRIRGVTSGGGVEGLPAHTFPTDDGGVDMKCPTEIAISDRREAELARNGFMPLVHRKNSSLAAFIGAQSLHKPPEYDKPEASANAQLAARLPYLFATCRFAHYLKCIVRDRVGSFAGREEMQSWLGSWISRYVEPNPAMATEEDKSRKPLAAADVVVEEDPANPGYYAAKVFLQPHYQLEGLTVSLRLVARLPAAQS